jgi:hypothetical protein
MPDKTNSLNATRSIAIALGLMASFTGMISGIFEILQGNVPAEFKFSVVGPEFSMWEDSTYSAYTIIPNFLITGIITFLISFLVAVWVIFFLHKRYGSLIMVFLSLGQFFTGGGIAIDVAILSAIMATQINRPLNWWKKITPVWMRNILSIFWPWAFALFILLSLAIFTLTILGVNSPGCQQAIVIIAGILFFPILFSVFGSFSRDLQTWDDPGK